MAFSCNKASFFEQDRNRMCCKQQITFFIGIKLSILEQTRILVLKFQFSPQFLLQNYKVLINSLGVYWLHCKLQQQLINRRISLISNTKNPQFFAQFVKNALELQIYRMLFNGIN